MQYICDPQNHKVCEASLIIIWLRMNIHIWSWLLRSRWFDWAWESGLEAASNKERRTIIAMSSQTNAVQQLVSLHSAVLITSCLGPLDNGRWTGCGAAVQTNWEYNEINRVSNAASQLYTNNTTVKELHRFESQSIRSFTCSSLSSPCWLEPSSGWTCTWTPPSAAAPRHRDVTFCELEQVESCWSSLWRSQASFCWVETTPSSGLSVTAGVWFLRRCGDRRRKLTFHRQNSSWSWIKEKGSLTVCGAVICWMRDTGSWKGLLRFTQRDASLIWLLWSEEHSERERNMKAVMYIPERETSVCPNSSDCMQSEQNE